jgi:hypothetical protein
MTVGTLELLPGQPERKQHQNAREFAIHEPTVRALIKSELRSYVLKQQTWYVTERSMLINVQTNLLLRSDREFEFEYQLIEIYDTLMSMNPLAIGAEVGAERCRFRCGARIGFYWGGLTAGDIGRPAVDFHEGQAGALLLTSC